MTETAETGPAPPQADRPAQALNDELRRKLLVRLAPLFAGELITPEDQRFQAARQVWNAMVDQQPGLIVRCTGTQDVVAAVMAARALNVKFSVRGGGHSVAGKAHTQGGMTIDLSLMRHVGVDAPARLVQAEGGCLLADVDEATEPHGLAVPLGTVSQTGLGGLALGGGAGWLSRKHGLTCDNFVSLEVVLADGRVVETSATQHPDLFWALRGGGGNFGIVTRFTLRAHPFGPLLRIGVSLYRPEDTEEALRVYARTVPGLPRVVGWHGSLKRHMPPLPFVPPELVGARMLMLFSMWLDDPDDPEGIACTEQLTRVGAPCHAATTVMPFGTGMQRAMDPEFPNGRRNYTKEIHLATLSDEAIKRLVGFWRTMHLHGEVYIISLGGALTDVAEDEAAFANRSAPYWLNFSVHWDEPCCDEENILTICDTADHIAPWTAPGVYPNLLNFDENHRLIEAYGGKEKYALLGLVKARYDPANLFRVNHNVTPFL
ncbi:FAD/FMN-containing dehydrogenase [Streptomyces sp. BK208]|uniref:FAD-binding oxidoreductase n=1 Tax=Streptomyces sp. BK208 TaxID=2512150 RepID=UPI001060CBA0|nr:FAD-binding oxidoreductase [Streptomyces sp. BK208]TDT39639.1 FAD/FMN-containing dehydrogenase [Streptomyces sp. BK208]